MKNASIFDGSTWQTLVGPSGVSTVSTVGNTAGITESPALPFQQWADEVTRLAAFTNTQTQFTRLGVYSPGWAPGDIFGDGNIVANGGAFGELWYGSVLDGTGRAVSAGYQMPTPTGDGYLRCDQDPGTGWYFSEPVIVQDAEPAKPAGGGSLWIKDNGTVNAWNGTAWKPTGGVSADAGNIARLGSDGLPLVTGDTTYHGEWSPMWRRGLGGSVESWGCEGFWTRSGRVVTATLFCAEDGDGVEDGDTLFGLPFAVAEVVGPDSVFRVKFAAQITTTTPTLAASGGSIGYLCSNEGGDLIASLLLARPVGFTINLTYLTDDPQLR